MTKKTRYMLNNLRKVYGRGCRAFVVVMPDGHREGPFDINQTEAFVVRQHALTPLGKRMAAREALVRELVAMGRWT